MFYLGNTYLIYERHEKAIGAYDRALELRPDLLPVALINKGVALGDLGRYEEALTLVDTALDIASDNSYVWDTKSDILNNSGRHQEALKASEKALSLIPDNAEALRNKGLALAKLGQDREAIEWLCRAWREREQFSDEGDQVAEILRWLKRSPEECH